MENHVIMYTQHLSCNCLNFEQTTRNDLYRFPPYEKEPQMQTQVNIASIRFDRASLIDAGWDISDIPDHANGIDCREIEARYVRSAADDSWHTIIMRLRTQGSEL